MLGICFNCCNLTEELFEITCSQALLQRTFYTLVVQGETAIHSHISLELPREADVPAIAPSTIHQRVLRIDSNVIAYLLLKSSVWHQIPAD